jgi:uncharacterized membrane protein
MSQNRAAARDRMVARHDYEVNLKAEIEIAALHAKLDDIRATELKALTERFDAAAPTEGSAGDARESAVIGPSVRTTARGKTGGRTRLGPSRL